MLIFVTFFMCCVDNVLNKLNERMNKGIRGYLINKCTHKKKQQIRKYKEPIFRKEMITKQREPQELGQRPFRYDLTAFCKVLQLKK